MSVDHLFPRGEGVAILPSETKGRKEPMTDEEFWALLARERREIEAAAAPLVNPTWRQVRATVRKDQR